MLGGVVTLCVTPGPAELLSLHAAALCLIVCSQQHNYHLSLFCQTSPALQTAALQMIGGTATAQEQGVGVCVRPLEVSLLSTITCAQRPALGALQLLWSRWRGLLDMLLGFCPYRAKHESAFGIAGHVILITLTLCC